VSLIISASRRTDIPAFFAEWFMGRIKAGWFCARNPFNPRQVRTYSIEAPDVDAIVFWTKNPAPIFTHLKTLDRLGYNYYFQFTLNDYPRSLEPGVPALEDRLSVFQYLSHQLGRRRVIWRYDPIILSSITPVSYHVQRISELASRLQGHTERLTVSFVDYYTKVRRRLKRVAEANGFELGDITARPDDLIALSTQLKSIAGGAGMELVSCAEGALSDTLGVARGACIDAALIRELFGVGKHMPKDRGQRPECLCAVAVDVGAYNTCRHQCAYCYANYSQKAILANLANHDSSAPSLVGGRGPGADGGTAAPLAGSQH